MRRRWVAPTVAALGVAGGALTIGGEEQDGSGERLRPAVASAAGPSGGAGCLRAGRPLARALRASLLVPGSGLRGVRAVASREELGGALEGLADGLYFVSSDIDGPGDLAGPDDVATWAVDRAAFTTANGVVIPADDLARRHSRLGAGVRLHEVGLSPDTHGHEASRRCAAVVAEQSARREQRELAR